MLGGDVAGKGLIPLTQGANGPWEATLFGKPVELGSEDELAEFERRMRLQGVLPLPYDARRGHRAREAREALDRAFEKGDRPERGGWVGLADEKLEAAGIPCLVMPGNDDPPLVKRTMNRPPGSRRRRTGSWS